VNLRQVYPARCSPLELSQIRGRLRVGEGKRWLENALRAKPKDVREQ